MTIKILSNSTINKIAAGEVIERPASVVKELVENSIDAGATKINIDLECAGKNLILVQDNGSGLTKDEMELAIQRHATSKLDENDLLNINSFGFRGEALPSIGAISKFKMTSQKEGTDQAYSLEIIGGKIHPTIATRYSRGTIIEVRDLFFATPARLKFLRSDKTELSAIIQCVKKIALAHPNIAFSLQHDGKEIINVKMDDKSRIAEIISNEFIENSAKIDFERDGFRITGYTSLPTYNRASADEQHIFINNRPVKDKILNIALKVAYQDYLARDRHPVSAMFLSIDPQQLDVNVHPAKSEVRFHNPNMIRGMMISAIKDALNNTSHRVSTTPSAAAINYMQKSQIINGFNEKETSQVRFNLPNKSASFSTTPRIDYALSGQSQNKKNKITGIAPSALQSITETGEIQELELDKYPLGAAKAQLHSTYIISQSKDSIIITDQHAAHERIGYEKIKEQIERNGLLKQRLLIPEIVEFTDELKAEILNDNRYNLGKLGLTLEKFGNRSIIVTEIPSLVGDINVQNLLQDLADHLTNIGENIVLTELIEHITETYACHYAIRAGRKLNGAEMNELLRQMENTPFSGQCNHGRQTYVELKLKDIEKLFGRK